MELNEVLKGFKRLCESLNGRLTRKREGELNSYVCILPEPIKNVYVTAYRYRDGHKSVLISAYSEDMTEKLGELEIAFPKGAEVTVSMKACGSSGVVFWGEQEFSRIGSEYSSAPKSVKKIKIERRKGEDVWWISLIGV